MRVSDGWVPAQYKDLGTYISLDEVDKAIAQARKDMASGSWRDIEFRVSSHESYGDEYTYLTMEGYRIETPEECADRAKEAKNQEVCQRAQYERLKKIYE